MKVIQTIIAFFVSLAHGPGGRMLFDVGAAIINEVGPTVFAELVETAKRAILANEDASVTASNSLKHDRVKNLIRLVASGMGVELSNTALDIIIKAALLAVRKVAS